MKTSFEKRIRAARWVLVIALGIYIGGPFLPQCPYSSRELLGVLWAVVWKSLIGLMSGHIDIREFIFSAVYGSVAVVMLATPFLVRPLAQHRMLLWILRVLIGVVTGLFSSLVIALVVWPFVYLAPGELVPMMVALWFEMAGLFVIPRRKRTELLESDPSTAIAE